MQPRKPLRALTGIAAALGRASAQLGDPRIFGPVLLSLLIVLLFTGPFLAVLLAAAGLIELLSPERLNLPRVGEISLSGTFTRGLVSKTSWTFWTYVIAPLSVAVCGLFLERIAAAVEARHYPQSRGERARGFGETLIHALRFLLLMAGVSLLALLLALLSGALAPAVFVLANGFLLSREYFEAVGLRHLSGAELRRLARLHAPALWALGTLLALALAVPVLNLLVPAIGVAAYTHLFHGLGGAGHRPGGTAG